MRAERGGSSNLARSFVYSRCFEPSNKENSLHPSVDPLPRQHGRRRRLRTRTATAAKSASPQYRARSGRPLPAHSYEQMAAPSPPPAQCRITLPRRLLRMRYRPIDPRVIMAIDPLLEGIPLSYIQRNLEEIGPWLLRARSTVTATPPPSQLPRQMQIICNDISIEPPSHVLAVYARTDGPRCRVTLFPVHALVLATTCAHLPAFPKSQPLLPAEVGGAVSLPVIPLRLPSPVTFAVLLDYLYTKRSDHMLSQLLPLPMVNDTASVNQLARKHAETFSVGILIGYAQTVHGVWSNACALGIFDEKLLLAMELAWNVLLNALATLSGVGFE